MDYPENMVRSPEMERFEMAMELCDLAESLLREKIRRTRPNLSPAEVEDQVDKWFLERECASGGDAEGHVISWPRRAA